MVVFGLRIGRHVHNIDKTFHLQTWVATPQPRAQIKTVKISGIGTIAVAHHYLQVVANLQIKLVFRSRLVRQHRLVVTPFVRNEENVVQRTYE